MIGEVHSSLPADVVVLATGGRPRRTAACETAVDADRLETRG
jgi:NAD(P)H-nitrite reductase large subunit